MVNAIDRDGKPAQNYRGFAEGINLFDNGNVGKALCQSMNGVCSLKAVIRSSQTVTLFYSTQLDFGSSFTARCNCKAGQSSMSSHACALLMKVVEATYKGITGSSSTDRACRWNAATQKIVTSGTLEDVYSHSRKPTLHLQLSTRQEMEANFREFSLDLDKMKGTLLCSVLEPPNKLEEVKATERVRNK
ncbi:hypothetical protein HPB52_019386 [Rhipicephalus sanguineus]|uniref:SWIM-type domain-containing protein n=1 Tax=Rhipicephalus sanguineus TaxID=34632 RepID=A0A9D4SPJ2_RHISA|nr:hypothetical protein HPB52_019386 [Rhipicephalus sanguineus]